MKKTFLSLILFFLLTITVLKSSAQSWSLTGNSGTKAATNFVGTTDLKALAFRTNNIEQMRISPSGNLGIGIKTPLAKLHVDNGPFVNLSSPGCFQIGAASSTNIGMDYSAIQARYNGTASRLYLNYFGGDVWIGAHNATPTAALYVSEDGRVAIGSDDVNLYALTVNSSPAVIGTIYSNNTESGIAVYADANLGHGVFGYSTEGFGVFARGNNNNALYAITDNNASYYAGYFVGDVYSTTGVYAGSDQKLKQNIKDFASAMDIINQLHPKQYDFRHDGNYKLMNLPQGNHYGLIAQDVEKILPDLVKNSKFDVNKTTPSKPADAKNSSIQSDKKASEVINFKALNYTELIPIIIKGMQEQQEANNKQQVQIQEQQLQIDKLEKIIEKLSVVTNTSSSDLSSENSGTYLKQNAPNPFTQNTIIYCNVPSSVRLAQLVIYNQLGSQVKSFVLTNGINNVTISAGSLPSGEYVYSLLLDNKKIDSKKMMLTK